MVSKVAVLVLFSSLVLAQEDAGLSQRLHAIDAQEQAMLLSFEKIKKEHEAKEEQSSQETVQNEENTTLSSVASTQETTVLVAEMTPDNVTEEVKKEVTQLPPEEDAQHHADTPTTSMDTTPQTPEPSPSLQTSPAKQMVVKPKVTKSKKTAKKPKPKHKKKTAKKKPSKTHKQNDANKVQTPTMPLPSPSAPVKKRTAYEHLDSVLNKK